MLGSIKKARKVKGLTQREFAKLIGVSRQTVGKWETGSVPKVKLWGKIADILGIEISLLSEIDSNRPTMTISNSTGAMIAGTKLSGAIETERRKANNACCDDRLDLQELCVLLRDYARPAEVQILIKKYKEVKERLDEEDN